MRMTRRQRFVLRLRLRYKIRRSFFVIAIPAIVAVIIIAYGILSGFAAIPNASGSGSPLPSNSADAQRLRAFEALFGNGTTTVTNSTALAPLTVATPPSPQNLDLLLVVAMVAGLAPFSVDVTRRGRLVRKYEEDFTDFLFELSELVRGGIDPIKATITLAEGNVGSISKQVKVVAKQMQIGYTFEQAMRNLGTSLKSPLIDKYIDLVIQASYSGGSVANLIQRASADLGTFLAIERDKRAGLAQYRLILYTGQFVLLGLCVILVVQFLPSLKAIGTIGSTSLAGSLLGKADIGSVPLERDLYYLVVLNGFLGGLVIGKISEAKMVHGIKHSLILVVVAFLAWGLFVVPATSGAGVHYTYHIVSYDKSGPAGIPTIHPLIVQVNNTDGSAAVGVVVGFTISGDGRIIPPASNTNTEGRAVATIILGNTPGPYRVDVTVNGNTTEILVQATAGGGG